MAAKKPAKSAAAKAREAEAADGFVVLEQCGVKLRIPVGNVPIAAIDAARAGDEWGCTKALLGEEQWNALRDAGAGSRDIDDLGKKLTEATGGN
jgi:hypothetical protein